MSERQDFLWQRFFAACSLLFVVFTFAGLEVFWPQPPSFALSADQTAAYYVEYQKGFFVGIVLCSIGMAFLLAWTVQFCLMLWRLEGRSHAVTAVTVASLAASPILLSFDLAIFGVAAFRPGETSPDVTRAMSDVAWLGSQHIWPMLALGMALAGVLIIKTGALRISPHLAWLLQPRRRCMRIRTTSHLLLQGGSILGERRRCLVPRYLHLGSMDSGRRLGNVSGARTAASETSATPRVVGRRFAQRDDIGVMAEAQAACIGF